MGSPFWMRDGFNAGETSVSSLTCYAFTLAQWSVSDACDFRGTRLGIVRPFSAPRPLRATAVGRMLSMIDTKQYVIKQIEERDIRFLRLWFIDILGNLKNIAITPSDIDTAFEEGIGFDGSSIDGLACVQDSDMLAHPEPSTFQVLPWRPSNNGVARMFCDIYTPDGEPARADSRHILMKMLKKASSLGYAVNVGTAVEYFCFKDSMSPDPIDRGGYFDLAPLDNAADLRRDTVLTLEQMGIPVEYSHHEAAPAQQEIDLRYCDALAAADAVITARLVIKETAYAQGLHATFMPKPLEGCPGSAMHVHQSLFDEEGNAFFDANDPDGYGLSSAAKSYIAGLLKYAPEYMLVTNQFVNSYKRFVPDLDAPLHACWGQANRSAMVRVPRYKPTKGSSTRVEVRSVDSAANPYLAFAVMIGAGLRGMEEGLELPAPILKNAFALSSSEREEMGLVPLPSDLSRAVDAFEQSELMREVLGDSVHSYLVKTKRAEWEEYRAHVTSWEIDRYLATL